MSAIGCNRRARAIGGETREVGLPTDERRPSCRFGARLLPRRETARALASPSMLSYASPVEVDARSIRTFATAADFERWLAEHHERAPEVWVKIHKKASGLRSITAQEAIDVVLCWGWIDAIRKSFDERSFLQRYTPRGRKSTWSQINRDNVARLIAAGRMQPAGQRAIDAAKADGRWDAAYAPMRDASVESLPADLRAAVAANARAARKLATLDKQNLFALAYRTNAMKTPAGRAKKIAALVATLARGETIVARPRPVRTPPVERTRRGRRRPRSSGAG
jgi:uncharacterized protein YdeI (YjbR/CyaY-like superfamily)